MGKYEILRHAGELTFGAWGAWAYDTWYQHNEQYFGGKLNVIALNFGLLPHGAALGLYEYELPRISLHISLLDPKSNAWAIRPLLGKRYASDVLLHEMVHQAIHQEHGGTGTSAGGNSSHNNPLWCDQVNRLMPMLGISGKRAEVIKQKRIDGKVTWHTPDDVLSRADTASFPHTLTADEYYLGVSDTRC